MASSWVRSTPVSGCSGVRMSKRGAWSRAFGFAFVRGAGSGAAGGGALAASVARGASIAASHAASCC